jgi:hypothetical protein
VSGPASGLKELSADLADALEDVNVPSYIIDASGVIRWVNRAGPRCETVRNHIRHLMRALGVNSRLQAAAVARREHL